MLSNFMFTDPKATCLQFYLEAMEHKVVAIDNFIAEDGWIGCSSESKNVVVHNSSDGDSVGYAYGACVSAQGESQWNVCCQFF